MVVYSDAYKPKTSVIKLHALDILYHQETGDRIAAAKVLQFVFENSELRNAKWRGDADLDILIDGGYTEWTDPGAKIAIPSGVQWDELNIESMSLTPEWEKAILASSASRMAEKR